MLERKLGEWAILRNVGFHSHSAPSAVPHICAHSSLLDEYLEAWVVEGV